MNRKYLIILSIIFAMFFSCSTENGDKNENRCPFPNELYRSHNFIDAFVSRDRCGFLLERHNVGALVIWPIGTQIEELANNFYNVREWWGRWAIYAFEIQIPRSPNLEKREFLYQKNFYASQDPSVPDYILVSVWVDTVFPNEISSVSKTKVPFFIREKTDSHYIVSTLIISETNFNEVVAGRPIFFVDYETTTINTDDFVNYGVTLIPAVFGSSCQYYSMGNWHDLGSVGILSAEINLFNYENDLLIENTKVLEFPSFVWQQDPI